jgi:hypothetical protein
MAVVYGDNAREHPRWGQIRRNVVGYTDAIKSAGGSVDLIDLPDIGIQGNTHMVMMDKNSDEGGGRDPEVARVAQPLRLMRRCDE